MSRVYNTYQVGGQLSWKGVSESNHIKSYCIASVIARIYEHWTALTFVEEYDSAL